MSRQPSIDESERAFVYEPWAPQSGQTVRVRISPESNVSDVACDFVYEREAVVVEVGSCLMGPFRYYVKGDGFEGWLAAAEMEPVA